MAGKPVPLYPVPLTAEESKTDERIIKTLGGRYFWSEEENTFVIQSEEIFDYSNRVDTEQLFLSGHAFVVTKILADGNLILLPSESFEEVYPEMLPDRSTLG